MTQNSPSTAAPAPSLSRRSLLVSGVCTAAVPAALAVGASPASARAVGTAQGVPTVGGSSHLPTGAGGAAPSMEPGEPWTDTNGSVIDRKSTRLNSSHVAISYAVFCLKKKNIP